MNATSGGDFSPRQSRKKKAWRLLENLDTLSASILKAVYFPEGDFLDAEVGSHASQIWRTIMEGKEILKQGLFRRIDSGKTPHAWNDNWIPRNFAMRQITCIKKDPPIAIVDFINSTTATWNLHRLREYFPPPYASRSNPLSQRSNQFRLELLGLMMTRQGITSAMDYLQ